MKKDETFIAALMGDRFLLLKDKGLQQTYTISRRFWYKWYKRWWYYIIGRCSYQIITYTDVKITHMWVEKDGSYHLEMYIPPQGDSIGVDIDFVL